MKESPMSASISRGALLALAGGVIAALISPLSSGAGAAADSSFYVPKPGEVFSYKDITPEIWDATEQNKKGEPVPEQSIYQSDLLKILMGNN
jgi:hypothetical protein